MLDIYLAALNIVEVGEVIALAAGRKLCSHFGMCLFDEIEDARTLLVCGDRTSRTVVWLSCPFPP